MSLLVRAALVGLGFGVAARLLMRVAALLSGSDREFDPVASALIAGLFAVPSVGAFTGARLFRRSRILGILVTAVTLVPLWLPGTSIAVVEVTEHAHGPIVNVVGVVAVALLIGACMVAAPLSGNRIGRRRAGAVDSRPTA